MTREAEAKARHDAALARQGSAETVRTWGSGMMIAGGVLLGVAVTAFASHGTPEIPSWIRQTILTGILGLWLGGMGFYVSGKVAGILLGQMADDRAAQEERHEVEVALLREIKRNQTFLMARPPGATAPGTFHLPSADTLDMVYRIRETRTELPEAPKPPSQARGMGELVDMAEFFNLGQEVERRKHEPPEGQN